MLELKREGKNEAQNATYGDSDPYGRVEKPLGGLQASGIFGRVFRCSRIVSLSRIYADVGVTIPA